MIKKTITLAIIAALTGCASVTGSTDQTISVQAFSQDKPLQGAVCELENDKGKWFITTPGTVQIDRSNEDLLVICTKDSHDTGMANAVSTAGASVAGNVGLALLIPIVGIIGAVVDHSSGATYKYPTNIQIYMGRSVTIEELAPGETSADAADQTPASDAPAKTERFQITSDGVIPEAAK